MLGYYLMFNRTCSEALDVYVKALNGKIKEKRTYKEAIEQNPTFPLAKEDENLIIYSKLKIGSSQLVCVDASERSLPGFNTYVFVKDEEELVRRAWSILVQDGVVYADLQPTTFAVLHGSLRDKFGINWMFTVPKPEEVKTKVLPKNMKSLPPRAKTNKPLPKNNPKQEPANINAANDSFELEAKPPKAFVLNSQGPPIRWD